ncbi:SDR family NAD(P)-dependent oxidoreductase [Segnochrobactrum spirostomi]|uniref:SDR family oxidoreductase n=1 Tax=Segnochrobactrum spirostomi TaxID=2608987 RepID=A0A6A7Y9S9_9HYPH|nr:SDR family oxidoreductase [Segnochrobactrum spirostomi]MQT14758.1 SDR family oxidoreductase [Segnochrobactrum spirostomi]
MSGQNVIVTGGASGLGKAVCLGLAAQGDQAIVLDLNAAAAEAAVAEIRAAGGEAFAVIGDITRRESAAALFAEAVAGAGRIHGLVNCAGVYPRRPILEISDDDWDFSFSVNVKGLYHVSVAAIEHMKANGGGRIVNVASIDAFKAHPKNMHYAAMKAAVVSLTKSLGVAFCADGVLINGVGPAAIATDKARAGGFLPELIAQAPIGRAAEPDDIADVILFLLSDKNRYMVGETIAVSGGYFIP